MSNLKKSTRLNLIWQKLDIKKKKLMQKYKKKIRAKKRAGKKTDSKAACHYKLVMIKINKEKIEL